MKIYTANSARCASCQIQRIEQGFIELGHEVTPYLADADLVYQNNAPFDQIIQDKINGKFKKEAKFIFNILDLAPHCADFPLQKIKEQVNHCDAITVISETVKKDCIYRLSTHHKYHVIYNPQMPVYLDITLKKHPFKYLCVGRVNDPNKRISLILDALFYLGAKEEEVGVIGTEYPGFGIMLGQVTNNYLNELYNGADYVFMPSKNEGIGLPAIEAAGCGAIPVICNDLSTKEEIFPREIFYEYNNCYPNITSLYLFLTHLEENIEKKSNFKQKLYEYYKYELEEKFNYLNVAKRIIEVYKNLK